MPPSPEPNPPATKRPAAAGKHGPAAARDSSREVIAEAAASKAESVFVASLELVVSLLVGGASDVGEHVGGVAAGVGPGVGCAGIPEGDGAAT